MNNNKLLFIVCTLVIILASFRFYRSPSNASNLDCEPDAVEYAIGGYRIVTNHSYDLLINNKSYPPQYPPFFSLFVVAPTLSIIGHEMGNSILAIFFFCLIGIFVAFLIGKIISGIWGGFWASLLIIALPWYFVMSQQVMTDVPCATIALLLLYLFLKIKINREVHSYYFLTAGVLCALSASFRPTTASFILPFLISIFQYDKYRKKIIGVICLFSPLGLIAIATLLYNQLVFGNFLKNGYNYWYPIPFNYFHLIFNSKFLYRNIHMFIFNENLTLFIYILLLIFFVMIIRDNYLKEIILFLKDVIIFILLATTPLLLVHFFYFFQTPRFFLPIYVMAAVLLGGILGAGSSKFSPKIIPAIQLVIIIILFILNMGQQPISPLKRRAVENIVNNTPKSSIIISAINPVYLGTMINCLSCGNNRRTVAVSNDVIYVSRLLKIEKYNNKSTNNNGRIWISHLKGILGSVYDHEIPISLEGNEGNIKLLLQRGVPVYLETSSLSNKIIERISKIFLLKRINSKVYELATMG
jgi:hypothetical protein